MQFSLVLQGLIWGVLNVFASPSTVAQDPAWPFDVTELKAPDGSVTAKFASIGATLTELWVKDKDGKPRDVVLGYDDPTLLATDPGHPYFNSIVGRYANRLKNGTFSIPITKEPQAPGPGVYKIPTNDHDGQVTLHGGITGWDRRNWTIVAKSSTSVTYKHVDEGHEGFPGTVTAFVTHTVFNGGLYKVKMRATASEKTPIMLTQHTYWNLDGFQDGTEDILDHHLYIRGGEVIELDGNAIPTGRFIDVNETPFDFRKGQKIADRWDETKDLCGPGCQGYDHAWIYDKKASKGTATSLWSEKSGIRVDMTTDQPSVQIYTSWWMNTLRKKAHGGPDMNYGRWSAIAIEHQGHVAAINTPEWGVDQIYHPGRPFEWSATHKFSTI